VLITGNVVHDNLLGIEVENSGRCAVIGNHAYGNTMGIFVDILPFLQRGTQEETLVAFNSVHDNNRPNTADPQDLLGILPTGIGILVAGGKSTTVLMNDVRKNGFFGNRGLQPLPRACAARPGLRGSRHRSGSRERPHSGKPAG